MLKLNGNWIEMAKRKHKTYKLEDFTGWNTPKFTTIVSKNTFIMNCLGNIFRMGDDGGYTNIKILDNWDHTLNFLDDSKMPQSFMFWKFLQKKTVGKRYIGFEFDYIEDSNAIC